MAHGVQARAVLAVGVDHRPRRLHRVGGAEHGLIGTRVFVPFVHRGHIDGAQLPFLQRIDLALFEAARLLLAADGKPELDQSYAAVDQLAFELRRLQQELAVLGLAAKPHDALHPRPVVPGAVEHDDFAGCGQVLDVTLEIPLAALGITRFFQRRHARAARVEVLRHALDGAALASRVAAFEQNDDALAFGLDPGPHLEQFDLQPVVLLLVGPGR